MSANRTLHGRHLIPLLRGLDKSESTKFLKFLESKYFNTSEERIRFYKLLRQSFKKPDWEWGSDTMLALYEKLYPGTAFKDIRMRRLCTEVSGLFHRFLSVEMLLTDSLQMLQYQTKALVHHSDPIIAEQALGKYKSKLKQTHSEKRWVHEWDALELQIQIDHPDKINHRETDLSFTYFTDLYVLTQTIRLALEQRTRAYTSQKSDQKAGHLPSGVEAQVKRYSNIQSKEGVYKYPVLRAQYLLYQSIIHLDQPSYFSLFMDYLKKTIQLLETNLLLELLLLATTYCAIQGRSMTNPYKEYLTELSLLTLNDIELRQHTIVPGILFNNLTVPCLQSSQFDLYFRLKDMLLPNIVGPGRKAYSNLSALQYSFFRQDYLVCVKYLETPNKFSTIVLIAQLLYILRAALFLEKEGSDEINFPEVLLKIRTILTKQKQNEIPEDKRQGFLFACTIMNEVYHAQSSSSPQREIKLKRILVKLKKNDGFLNTWLTDEIEKLFENNDTK